MQLSITFQFPAMLSGVVNDQIADLLTEVDADTIACDVNLLIDTEAKDNIFRAVLKELVFQHMRNQETHAVLASA